MKKFYTFAICVLTALASYAITTKLSYMGPEIKAQPRLELPEEFTIDSSKLTFFSGVVEQQEPVQSIKSQQTMAVGDWQTLEGTCTFTDDAFTTLLSSMGLVPRTWNVTIQKHKSKEIYRVADPYAGDNFFEGYHDADPNRYLYLNAVDPDRVFFCDESGNAITYYGTGVDIGYGDGRITTAANMVLSGAMNVPISDDMYAKLEDGAFVFPDQVLAISFANFMGGQWAQANINGKMKIALPNAKDYRCDVSFGRFSVRGEKMYISLEIGKDVAVAKLGMFVNEPWISQSSFEGLVGDQGQTVSYGSYEIGIDGAQGRTSLNFVLICYDANGKVVGCDYTEAVVDIVNNPDWVTLDGKGMYCEGVYSGIYNGLMVQTYEVTVQQHVDYPGYFRIVNPYTSGEWTAASVLSPVLDTEMEHYLYIDATIPDKVFIEDSPTGVNLGYGEGMVSSIAFVKRCYDEDATGFYGNLDKDGLITFPSRSLTFSEKADANGTRYYVSGSDTMLQLPESWSSINSVTADDAADSDVEYYNIQGMRVYNVANTPGLYIRKQGDKTEKVIIK